MEWSTDTKNGYDGLEVYMEYRYVFVSSTDRNHAKMAAFSFNIRMKIGGWGLSQYINDILPV